MNYSLLISLAASALATPPACLLACVAEVSKSDGACGNSLEDINCIYGSLADKIDSCLDSKCPNNNADAAKSAFTSAASANGATSKPASSSAASSTEASSTEASSAAPTSSAAESSAAPASSEAPASSKAPASSAAPEKSEAPATSKAPASSAAPAKSEAPASSAPAKSEAAPSEAKPSQGPNTSVAPGNGAAVVGSSIGLMGAFIAAALL